MSEPLVFSFDGIPVGKGRPRATTRGGFARMYTPAKTRTYESAVKQIAAMAMRGRKPFVGALSVSLRLRLGVPKSMSKKVRAVLLSGGQAYLGSFDIDNLVKSVLDGCNGVCWGDDKQIVRLFATKGAAEAPGIDIRIEPLEPQP